MKKLLLIGNVLLCSGLLMLMACEPVPTATRVVELPTATSTLPATTVPVTATHAPTKLPTPTQTLEPTNVPTATPTFTPVPTFALSGTIFFDYNGNGVRDSHEPPISGAVIRTGKLSATSGEDGKYTIAGVSAGKYDVKLSAKGFSYISLSVKAFQGIEQPMAMSIDGDKKLDFGLMQGFLTLPFGSGTVFTRPSSFGFASVFDLDSRLGSARAYDPSIPPSWEATAPPWVMDNHIGLDFCIPEGTSIRAAMPGKVTYVGKDEYGGLGIWLCYSSWATYYNHNSKILVQEGQAVQRGQEIALSGNTGQSGEPHLHFSLATCTTPPKWLDPYRDMTNSTSKSYWTKDNDPQYLPVGVAE